MKKVFLFFAVAMAFAACGSKANTEATEEATEEIQVEEPAVVEADTTVVVADSVVAE